MSSSKCPPWNQLAFYRPLMMMAVVLATASTGTSSLRAIADEMPENSASTTTTPTTTTTPAVSVVAPDVPPATTEQPKIHEGSVVKIEMQAPLEPEKTTDKTPEKVEEKTKGLTAPVPGNQDNALPQPTFNAINTIETNVSNAVTAASGADASDSYAENYSITKNVLTYPLNDPVNGQFTGQPASPLVLRESSESAQAIAPVMQSRYQELPLSFDDAKVRLGQLKLMAAGTHPQDALEHVNQFIRWLSDIVDAHNKMSVAFSKNEVTKPTGVMEKQMSTKFAHLRYESQLLKADLLIEEHRYPEALAPLVEIVLAMPANAIGKAAYQRLQDLGFSTADAAATSATTSTSAESAQRTSGSKLKNETESTVNAAVAEPQKKVAMVSPGLHTKRQAASKSVSPKTSQVKKTAKVTTKKSHKA
ncbi:MAG: hypothetical protein P4L53_07915 [Candidatus Obscuribacterales bacterium]|nr:hypothetical protein [Candidatus Obscuribacterales bacterium]